MAIRPNIDEVLAAAPHPLPSTYLELLRQAANSKIEVEDPTLHRCWRLLPPAELLKPVTIRPAKPAVGFRQLIAYAEMLESVGIVATEEDNLLSSVAAASSFAIAEDNGDVLFLRLDRAGEVWCFHHDGADMELLCSSVAHLIIRASPHALPGSPA